MSTEWDRRYDRPDYLFGETPNAFLAGEVERVRLHRRALAIADGEGRNGVWLAEQGLDVVSIDASAVALQKARRLAAHRGVTISTELVDLERFDWPEAEFDLVVAIFIQFAGPAFRRPLFAGMTRALAPGGTLLLHGYRPEQLGYGTGGPPFLENLYTEPMLRSELPGLEILSLTSHDSVIEEGTGHSGLSALIDLVARKPD
ncbi:class I SAM-dependent methyltransferase [Arsenicitalea aurantiaca]|uniref:Class I SAM-dependent methyltransferase n=1 Tax=Arsenicitalea aurantiaca TaxID=1783274 RepID=A0A433XFF5_9HYPH|nr:class I SAM-dependent methyltransferase [Arsenicitalea aurantiaca]RUT32790.1 class I SAM-dependent methyltransferase [Arsenicitalea aurantiaca]